VFCEIQQNCFDKRKLSAERTLVGIMMSVGVLFLFGACIVGGAAFVTALMQMYRVQNACVNQRYAQNQ
jgi:dolichol kinase